MTRKGSTAWLLLASLHLLVLAAGVVGPYRPDDQAREFALCPPTIPQLRGLDGRLHWPPVITGRAPADDPSGAVACRELAGEVHPIRFLNTDADGRWRLFGVDPPMRIMLLGADGLGRDLFSRLVHGARLSLFAGLLATATAVTMGLAVGLLAGTLGPVGGSVVAFVIDVTLALPWIYLLLAVRAVLPLTLEPRIAFLGTALLIGLVGWARLARLVRARVQGVAQRDFVAAARAFGVTRPRLLLVHLLPHAWPVALTQAALLLPHFVLAEMTLSFFGLGAGDAEPSWGTLLAGVQQVAVLADAWWLALPAIALVPVFLLYYLAARSVGVAPDTL